MLKRDIYRYVNESKIIFSFIMIMILMFFSILPVSSNQVITYERLNVPIFYKDQAIVLSNKEEVICIEFVDNIHNGINFKFRYLSLKNGNTQNGKGNFFEDYTRKRSNKKHVTLINNGSKLYFKLGKINIEWSYLSDNSGWFYFKPELINFEVINKKLASTIKLELFIND